MSYDTLLYNLFTLDLKKTASSQVLKILIVSKNPRIILKL